MSGAVEAVTKCPVCGATASAPCVHILRVVLGDLIDALNDELRFEVGQSRHVMNEISCAVAFLGPEYQGYREWL